jgi:hypothetical protein
MGRCRRWLPAAAKGSLRAAINVLLLLRAYYRWPAFHRVFPQKSVNLGRGLRRKSGRVWAL